MMSFGADGYISKPFMPERLSEEMQRLLGGVPNESF